MNIDILYAKTFIGLPYVWGGESMSEGGFDCSGFAYNIFKAADKSIKRLTAQGYYDLFKSNVYLGKDIQKGDVLFFGTSKKNITHIAFAVSHTEMIESVGTKKNTKNNKGKGICINNISRRKDLRAIIRFEKVVDYEKPKVAAGIPNLKVGSKGFEVENLQKDLNFVCNSNLKTDGIFGIKTKNALINFQKSHGLTPDGVYGSRSWYVMKGLI